jgi:hypothetical protein
MKSLIIFLIINISAHAWEIESQRDEAYLKDAKTQVSEKVIADLQHKESFTKELNSEVTVIYYLESIAGTTSTNKTFNCAGYSKKMKKFIFKDKVCLVKELDEGKEKTTSEAKFTADADKIHYVFEELKQTFPLKLAPLK